MGENWKLSVDANLDNLATVRHFLEKIATLTKINPAILGDLLLATDEAITNIITHGYHSSGGVLEIEVQYDSDTLTIAIRDQAAAYNPLSAGAPDLDTSPLEQDKPGGFGVYLIKRMVDDVHYRHTQDGHNELILVKRCA